MIGHVCACTKVTLGNVSIFYRFQRIELARAAAVTPVNTVAQANFLANQSNPNTPNEETMKDIADESVVLPPPPGFN